MKGEVSENRYAIVVSNDSSETQSLSCDMCNFLLRQKDFDSVQKFGVCQDCMFDFVEQDMSGWATGNRPSTDTINIKIEDRLKNPFFFMRDRPI